MRLTDVVTIFHLNNLHKGQSEVWLLFIALFFLIKSGRKKVPGSPASPISFRFQAVAGLLVKTWMTLWAVEDIDFLNRRNR